MFVVSVSRSKIRKILLLAVIVILVSLCFVAVLKFLDCFSQIKVNSYSPIVSVNSEDSMLSFVSNYGWQVDDEPIEVREVIIPETFDEVYNNYNKIQLEQGFNLEKYAGQRVKKWTYIVRNYPDTLSTDDYVRINILVSDDMVIGGDVCSVKLDGFMHGFCLPGEDK